MSQDEPLSTPWRISRLTGEFLDKDTEQRYFAAEVLTVAGHLSTITITLGLLFLAFAIPDWYVLASRSTFLWVLAMRIVCFLYLAFLGFHIRKSGSASSYCRWITSAELLCVALFILTFLLYDQADFLIQSFGLMLLLSAFHLVPNRFPYQLAVSLVAIAAFLNAGWITIAAIPVMNLAAVAVYLILIMAISTIAFVRTSYYKRRQYENSEYLRQLSITDPLTRIYNRQKFNEELWREISRYRRTKAPLSVVLMDFDDFKGINDRYGHLQGDRVLIQAASVIRREIRVTDVFARWGGEEYVLLLPGTTLAQAGELSERLREMISALCLESGVLLPRDTLDDNSPAVLERMPVSCSFGIAGMRENDTPETFIQRADKMVYSAKSEGKNRIVSEPFGLLAIDY